MTAEILLDCIGMLDEKYIAEAENYSPAKRRIKIYPYISAAACFIVIAVSILLINGSRDDISTTPNVSVTEVTGTGTSVTEITMPSESDTVISENTASKTETTSLSTEDNSETEISQVSEIAETIPDDNTETAVVPKWEDINESERYTELKYKGIVYCISQAKFDENDVGFIENGEVYGFDEYANEIKTKACAYYRINNISDDYMIAVLTADGKYTAYFNIRYCPATLGEYLAGTDYLNRCELAAIKSDDRYDAEADAAYSIMYDIPDIGRFVTELLVANSSARFVNSNELLVSHLMVSDGKTSTIKIYDNGYIKIGTMPAGYYYDIGEDAVREVYNYLEKNADIQKVFYSPAGGEMIQE